MLCSNILGGQQLCDERVRRASAATLIPPQPPEHACTIEQLLMALKARLYRQDTSGARGVVRSLQ